MSENKQSAPSRIINAYWLPEPTDVRAVNHKPGDLGFRNDLPWPLPATVGAEYFGEGRNELPLEKELNTTFQGEYHMRGGNVVPSSGGVPLVNPYSKTFTHSRDAFSQKFERPRTRAI